MSDLRQIKRALISVYDKTSLLELARFLTSKGIIMMSTGGTARFLLEHGFNVTDVTQMTQFPEILDGRVKTISSRVFASLLFDRDKTGHWDTIREFDIPPIDLLVVNLYPFHKVSAQADASEDMLIENIDIGGPAMLRASAKNYKSLTVLSDPCHYQEFISLYEAESGTSLAWRKKCALQAFSLTADYDRHIAKVFEDRFLVPSSGLPKKDVCESAVGNQRELSLTLTLEKRLRYGENPHQSAWVYRGNDGAQVNLAKTVSLAGKELSYNNLLDAQAAIWALRNLIDHKVNPEPAAVVIKHGIPCGAAIATHPRQAIYAAIASDPISAFGGIIALSTPLDLACAEALEGIFFEVVIAPSFSDEARTRLLKKKNLRMLAIENLAYGALPQHNFRSIFGGILVQDYDTTHTNFEHWSSVTAVKPTFEDLSALDFAFRVVKATPSNAITVASSAQLLGIGAGQPNRIQSVELAISGAKMRNFDIKNAALASDAFFPFDDCLVYAHKSGINLVIQPGGSIRDQEIIARADDLGMCMLFTHQRHFRH